MASKHSTGMIDGYSSVQAAARRAAAGKTTPKTPPPAPPKPSAPTSAQPANAENAKRIGHTVMPTRHELVCYACGYAFAVTGSMDKLFCPKCKEQLESGDITIDERQRKKDCRTVGSITVTQEATVVESTLTATRIIVGGDVRLAKLNPTRTLELDTGARIDIKSLQPLAVTIRENATLSFDDTLRCRTLDVHGELCARIQTEGPTTLHPGSRLNGELTTPHFIVHDGAALRARLMINSRQANMENLHQ